jgi:steroid delta-isomerase
MYPGQVAAQVHKYLAALNAHDIELIEQLYDDDAVAEDPAGSKPREGMAAIKDLYTRTFTLNISARLTGDLRISSLDAAFPMTAFLESEGNKFKIDVITVCKFNEAGKIVSRYSYWGPDNLSKR